MVVDFKRGIYFILIAIVLAAMIYIEFFPSNFLVFIALFGLFWGLQLGLYSLMENELKNLKSDILLAP